jgi:hypothetical protein
MPSPTRLDDTERGMMEVVIQHPPAVELPPAPPISPIYSAQFKVNNTNVEQIRSQILNVGENAKPPPQTPKRKVSRLIRFSLWFNTYRFVLSVLRKISSNPSNEGSFLS